MPQGCLGQFFCAWTGKNFTGEKMEISGAGHWHDLPAQAHSFYNHNGGDDAAVAPGTGGRGGKTCVDSQLSNSSTAIKSVYIAHTGGNC
ncbi:peptidase inhibitor family I36 protein [Streptomyces sp. TS71-3]|uniref:peptidase inhibitor family I36 protein n=1 Tax=Streptomyces sp. TS71-3 TaxID=2733862 RepID=UPI002017FFFE|nr:peptidase inhibitor family I36 protein [Streptomyces sp. TS71-3]